jgi:hypothetical protein
LIVEGWNPEVVMATSKGAGSGGGSASAATAALGRRTSALRTTPNDATIEMARPHLPTVTPLT